MNNLKITSEDNKTLLVLVNNEKVLSIKKGGNNPFTAQNRSGKLKLNNYEASIATPIEIGVRKNKSVLIKTGENIIFNIPIYKSWDVKMVKEED